MGTGSYPRPPGHPSLRGQRPPGPALTRIIRDDPALPFPAEFLGTVFMAGPPPGGWPPAFAVVTAFNPRGLVADPASNDAATKRLEEALAEAGRSWFPVTGASPDLSHREPGFGIPGIGLAEAWRLALRFDQLAFFWVENGVVHVCVDASGKGWEAGRWAERLVSPEPGAQKSPFR